MYNVMLTNTRFLNINVAYLSELTYGCSHIHRYAGKLLLVYGRHQTRPRMTHDTDQT